MRTERARRVVNLWSSILGKEGFVERNRLGTKLLTAVIAKNIIYNKKNMYSKTIDVTDCETCSRRLLAIECLMLVIYQYRTAKPRALY